MSYQVLARKWRPKDFASLVGQEHVVRALSHALSAGRLHHAYLFTGTRGIGKTTIARILAKSLNCETGVTPTPCNTCSACNEIDAGRFVDLLEVDAATNTRVEEMRQLLENAVYAPTRGRYKVYVIDEVHMLSNSAFNAMLKTLEEPPEHVKFILATTDPQKIPVTVLSRCLQFNLKQMSPQAIAAHLSTVLEHEGIAFETAALQMLAHSAGGSMRDALSLLDQAIAHGGGKVDAQQVREMLGTVDRDHLLNLLDHLQTSNAAAMIAQADDMAGRSLAFDAALKAFASLITQIQVAQLAPSAIADDLPERERILKLAAQFSPEFVQLAYQIVVHGLRDLPLAPDPYAGFIMTLLRLAAFAPETRSGNTASPPVQAATAAPTAAALSIPSANAVKSVAVAPPFDLPVSSDRTEHNVPVAAAAQTPAAWSPDVKPDWTSLLATLPLSGMARELAHHCELREQDGPSIVLRLPPVHRHLLMKPAQDKIHKVLSEYLQQTIKLHIELGEVENDTPAQTAQRERQNRQDQAVAAIESDTFVREIIELFDANLIDTSIKPV